ncbi:UNKNOWN [Stylonychia lemnae]|uniref:Uncharacterized protein n=1 Tax=Stylonychia lemnae TaxID=5949 RepID=A0A078AZ50_STYLE|nr:UNKNOWN [Stylonychia lemnae]|eukprot:CDW87414.1 UNKNOWN [Stylonychia lemnae]
MAEDNLVSKGTFTYDIGPDNRRQILRNFTSLQYEPWQESSNTRTFLRLRAVPCKNSTDLDITNIQRDKYCATNEEIDDLINKFDAPPFKNEISVNLYNINRKSSFAQYLKVTKKQIQTQDNWFSSYLDNKNYTLFETLPGRYVIGSVKEGGFEMFTLIFVCSNEELYIQRQVFTLTDLLSLIGGFSSIVILITRYLAQIYSSTSFQRELINKLFTIPSCSSYQQNSNSNLLDTEDPHKLKQKIQSYLSNRKSCNVTFMYLRFLELIKYFKGKNDQ